MMQICARRWDRRAAEYAQSYTWDKIAAQIVGVYQALLNKNKENGIR